MSFPDRERVARLAGWPRYAVPGLVALALAACSGEASGTVATGTPVECALSGAAGFAPDCQMERAERGGEKLLVLRHPDGGFRRFRLGVPGVGMVAADGVEEPRITAHGDIVEVRVGTDRYRLPVAG